GQGDPAGSGNKRPQPRMSGRSWIALLVFTILFNIVFYWIQLAAGGYTNAPQTTLSYSAFVAQVRQGHVMYATSNGTEVHGHLKKLYKTGGKSFPRYTTTISTDLTPSVVSLMQQHKVDVTLTSTATPLWLAVLGLVLQALPFLLLVGLLYFSARASMQQQQGV